MSTRRPEFVSTRVWLSDRNALLTVQRFDGKNFPADTVYLNLTNERTEIDVAIPVDQAQRIIEALTEAVEFDAG